MYFSYPVNFKMLTINYFRKCLFCTLASIGSTLLKRFKKKRSDIFLVKRIPDCWSWNVLLLGPHFWHSFRNSPGVYPGGRVMGVPWKLLRTWLSCWWCEHHFHKAMQNQGASSQVTGNIKLFLLFHIWAKMTFKVTVSSKYILLQETLATVRLFAYLVKFSGYHIILFSSEQLKADNWFVNTNGLIIKTKSLPPALFTSRSTDCQVLLSLQLRILHLPSEYWSSQFCTLFLFKNLTFSYIFKEVKKIPGARRIVWRYSHQSYVTDSWELEHTPGPSDSSKCFHEYISKGMSLPKYNYGNHFQ